MNPENARKNRPTGETACPTDSEVLGTQRGTDAFVCQFSIAGDSFSRSEEPTDQDLLKGMLDGGEQAFTMLYRRRQAGVYRFALQMSGSKAVAEDVTQEVFLALMRDASGYDPRRGSVAAYLYGIARNKVLRFLERESAAGTGAEPVSGAAVQLDELRERESIQAVRDAVLALPAHYREAVVLCELQEMTYEEAAAALGCALGTVRSRLHRGRELLAKKLRTASRAGSAGGSISPARSWS